MKYTTVLQKDNKSFSAWEAPRKKYRMACCDCGLVHDLEFKIIGKGGRGFDLRVHQIQFRLRRNILATAAIRRKWQVRN